MAEEVVDHTARSLAQRAIDRQDTHERFCEERARKSELFEAEMKAAQSNLAEQLREGITRIHQRLDEDAKSDTEQRVHNVELAAKASVRQQILWSVLTVMLTGGATYIMSIMLGGG